MQTFMEKSHQTLLEYIKEYPNEWKDIQYSKTGRLYCRDRVNYLLGDSKSQCSPIKIPIDSFLKA